MIDPSPMKSLSLLGLCLVSRDDKLPLLSHQWEFFRGLLRQNVETSMKARSELDLFKLLRQGFRTS